MGLFKSLACKLWPESVYQEGRDNPAKRLEARASLGEEAMNGSPTAAACLGELYLMEPADIDAALYWYEYAAQRCRQNALMVIAARTTYAAAQIALRDDPGECGPETARALAWAMIAREAACGDGTEHLDAALEHVNVTSEDVDAAIAEIMQGTAAANVLH